MTQYWSYLTNKKNELLTFESHFNLEKMKSDLIDLNKFEFFDQFKGFDKVFISSKNPIDNPLSEKLYEINIC
jgi:hypothetical protein